MALGNWQLRMKAGTRWLVLLAALLTFAGQSIVLETHRHTAVASVIDTDRSTTVSVGQHPASGTPANCPVCRELAHLSVYLPPAPVVLERPPFVDMPVAAVATLLAASNPRSHAWRSRAPPASSAA